MNEKKQIKISLKTEIILFIIGLILIAVIIAIIFNHIKTNGKNNSIINTSKDYKEINIEGKTYYQRLNENVWDGNYHKDVFFTLSDTYDYNLSNIMEVVTYEKYLELINSINAIQPTESNKIINYYTNNECNYVVLSIASGSSNYRFDLIDYIEKDNKIIIYGNEDSYIGMSSGSGAFIAIPTNMPLGTEIEYRQCYTSEEIDNLKKYGTIDSGIEFFEKPIIYLYPQQETKMQVKLGYPDAITCSYPSYPQEGWKVVAKPNGNLEDLKTGKNLYSLYYESKTINNFKIEDDGFIVKGVEIAEFLEEKLAILGLTQRETEEFIIYWLPKLQENEYNYIRFADIEEINKSMPLEINPKPDTIIRILMIYKGLENPIQVKEQQLTTPERKGFVAVEWGGTEIK